MEFVSEFAEREYIKLKNPKRAGNCVRAFIVCTGEFYDLSNKARTTYVVCFTSFISDIQMQAC